jgi:hypothetical protein
MICDCVKDEVFDLIGRMNYREEELRERPIVTDFRTWAIWKNIILDFIYSVTEPLPSFILVNKDSVKLL